MPDRPGVAAAIFGPLAEANINVDMIVQNVSLDGSSTDITFTVPRADSRARVERLEKAKAELEFAEVKADTNVAKISVIGVGMRSHAGVAPTMFKTLADKGDQHPGDLDLGDQGQRAGRRGVHRAGGAGAAHRLWAGRRIRFPHVRMRELAGRQFGAHLAISGPCTAVRPQMTAQQARPDAAAWRVCACIIDRSFVVIRLKHPAV